MPPQKKGKSALKKGKSSGKTLDTQRSLYQTELENLRKHLGLNEKQVLAVIEEMTKIKVPGKDLSSDNTADDLKRKQDNGDGSNDNETNDTPPKRFRKAKDEIDAEYNLLIQPQLTLEVDNRLQTFNQVNVSNNQNRSLWHAIQLLWLGRERDTGRTLVLKYPVHARVQQLWDSVVHGPSNTPVYQARHKLYSAMLEENEELEGRIEDRRFGDLDMLQLIADALDLEIFIYIPQVTLNNTIKKTLIFARGTPQTNSSRQLHIAHWANHVHWTALTPVDAGFVPLVAEEERWPHPRFGVLVPLSRLPVGHVENVELRSGGVSEEALDGRVPDMREFEEDDDQNGITPDDGNIDPSPFPRAARRHVHNHPKHVHSHPKHVHPKHNHPKHVHPKHSHPEHNHPKHNHPKHVHGIHNHPKHHRPQHDHLQHNHPPHVRHHPPEVHHHPPQVHHHQPQIHHHPPTHNPPPNNPKVHYHPPTHNPSPNNPKVHYHPPTYTSEQNTTQVHHHPPMFYQDHNNRQYNDYQYNYQESQKQDSSDHVHFHFQKSGSDKKWERIRGPE